jgi:hypothetical protein
VNALRLFRLAMSFNLILFDLKEPAGAIIPDRLTHTATFQTSN